MREQFLLKKVERMSRRNYLKDTTMSMPEANPTWCEEQKDIDKDSISTESEALSKGYPGGKTETRICTRICDVMVQRRGIFWALTFVILTAFVAMTSKLLSGKVSPNQIVLYRSFTLVLFTAPNLLRQRVSYSLPLKAWCLVIFRGLIGMAMGISFNSAVQRVDLSTAKCIRQGSTVLTCFFACVCLKEDCSIVISLSCFISVVGVFLVVQPPSIFGGLIESSNNNAPFGILAAFAAAMCVALIYVSLRLLAPYKINAQLINFSYGCIGFLGCASLETIINDWSIPKCGYERQILLATCVLGYLQLITFTLALQTENAAVVSVISTTTVFCTFVLDYAFFGVIPNAFKVTGAFCVTGSSIGAIISSYYAKKKLSESRR